MFVDFSYVVEREEQNRICFLSGQERYPKIKKSTAPPSFMDPETNGIISKITNKVIKNECK